MGGRSSLAYLYVHSVMKIALFFKEQVEFFLISCLAVVKRFVVLSLVHDVKTFLLKKRRHFFFFIWCFLWIFKYVYCHCIYNCVKNINMLCWVKKNIFFSLFTPRFPPNVTKFFFEGGGRGNSLKGACLETEVYM